MHVLDLFRLDGKVALVTGGAGILGRSIVEALAEAGASVISASRNKESGTKLEKEFADKGLKITSLIYDQADHLSIIQLINSIRKEHGRLNIFVNNAVLRPMQGYDGDIESVALSMRVNATGAIDIIRETILLMEAQGGSIINIGSIMGDSGPDLSNYEGTDMGIPPPDYFFHKGGLINISRYFAKVLTGKNIRVNTISPAGIFNHQHEIFLENYTNKIPLRRLANADDIKGLIVLLASEAGSYINGQNIVLDGGMLA